MQFNKALSYNILFKSINVIILFFTNVLFVRIVGAEVTGVFFYLITVLSFITLIVSGSLETGFTFYASKDPANSFSFSFLILLITVFQIIVAWVIILFAVKNQTSLSLNFLLMFVISNILISNFTGLYISQKWFIPVNTIVLAINFFALLFFGWMLLNPQVNAIAKAQKTYIIVSFFQALLLIIIFFIKNKMRAWKFPSFHLIKKIFRYSLFALIGNISFFLVTRLDYVFVRSFCSSQALGNYVQVSKIAQMFVLIPTMAASVIFPYAASNKTDILNKVQWLCSIITMIIIAGAIGIILFGKWIFPWFFGEDFNLMYSAMLFYLPGVFSLCISSLLASFISGKGFVYVNVTASVIALIIVIAGDVIFIPRYGINAAAAVSSFAYTACLLVLLIHVKKTYHLKLSTLFNISFSNINILKGPK